jgi:hypothetical protein
MATRQPKSNREKAAALDAKIYGKERQYDRLMTKMELVDALTFYNSFSRKDLEKHVTTFMKKVGYSKTQISDFNACEDWKFPITSAKLAAVYNKSGEIALQSSAINNLKNDIDRCIEQGRLNIIALSKEEEKPAVRKFDPTTKKAIEIINDIDMSIDERDWNFDVYACMQQNQATPGVAKYIEGAYTKTLEELMLAYEKVDEQLVEGYSNFKKPELKKFIGFVENILTSAKKYTQNVKAMKVRKPRKLKVKSAAQLTTKVKFCKSFPELKLVSVDPTSIVGAQSVWIYNTKYRKLGVYIAAPNQTLSIKGTTIINYNEELSLHKTLRKPEIQLNEFTNANKVTLRKFLENINGKAATLNGRLNEDTVILKAFT